MAFKVKRKKRVCPPQPEFFRQQELDRLVKKHKGKFPPFFELTRTGTRRVSGVHRRIYQKGRIVQFEGKLARVDKITTKGIVITPFTKPDKKGITGISKKKVFVSSQDIEKGKVYPFFTNFPLIFGGLIFGRNGTIRKKS